MIKQNAQDMKEFRDSGLLWWVNRSLHLFGWCLAWCIEDRVLVVEKCKFRGFSPQSEEDGFKKLTTYMKKNAISWEKDIKEVDE